MLATPTIEVVDGHKGLYNAVSIPKGKVRGFIRNIPGFASACDGDELTLWGSHLLPVNDKRGLIDSKTYSPSHPRSISLMCNDGSSELEQIQFQHDAEIVVDFERDTPYDTVVIPLFHSHVLWSYVPCLSPSPIDEDGSYWFTLVSVGPHLSAPEIKDNEPIYVPPGLSAPRIAEGFVAIRGADGDVIDAWPLVHAPAAGGALLLNTFTRDELRELTVDGKLHILVCFDVPRSYFDLSSVIDLTVRPTVPASATATVEKILRGEKPKGWDFKIMGGFRGSGDASVVYYMHSAAMESKSPTAKKAAASIPAREKGRGARVSLDADGLAAAVQIAYGVEVPLPKTFERNMAITLEGMFADHFTSVVVPQWEREICRRALALDVRNPTSSSMVELLRLLNAIWEMPYGYFPVAKRVAVGVLADMMHLGPYTSTHDFVQNTVLPSFHESGMNPTNLLTVLASLAIHLNTIPGVKKVAGIREDGTEIVCKKTAEKEAEQTPSTPPSEPTHVETAHVELELPPAELPYPVESTDIDPVSNRSGAASTIEKTVEKEAEQIPSTPPSEPTHVETTHVELEMPPAELPYPEESTDIDPASVPTTRSCSIL